MVKLKRESKTPTEKEFQTGIEKEGNPKDKKITLKLKYRDETCQHCKKTFRAGERCEGYMDFNIIGYSGVGVNRHGYFCNHCMEVFIYRFMGESSLLDFNRCPYKLYSMLSIDKKKQRPSGMTIKNKHYDKYDKIKFEKEVKKFITWVKKNEPWNIVDYAKFSGLRK